jgi:hypothetical protein
VAQDSAYRKGKWYSISNGQGFNFNTNRLLDTIWFISDSLAGWNYNTNTPNVYVIRKTYFSDYFHICIIAPDPNYISEMDTFIYQCAMTTTGDTFGIYWPEPLPGPPFFNEMYVKVKN